MKSWAIFSRNISHNLKDWVLNPGPFQFNSLTCSTVTDQKQVMTSLTFFYSFEGSQQDNKKQYFLLKINKLHNLVILRKIIKGFGTSFQSLKKKKKTS